MINLKKIIFAATLAVASLGFSVSSNAALITHDILVDDGTGAFVVGNITVHLFENGATGLQDIEEFVSMNFLGDSVVTTYLFGAIIDRDNVFAGLEFLFFDVDDAFGWGYQGIYDAFAFDPAFDNYLDIWDPATPGFIFAGELSLSEARVVSEPSVLALFALALVGFGMRRRAL